MAVLHKVDLNRVAIFKRVVELGSFSKTALEFSLPKSNISRHVSLLEQEIGVQLIYRTTRQLQLTDQGKRFYAETKDSVAQLKFTIEQVNQSKEKISGKIRITAPEDFGISTLAPLVEEFHKLYPEIELECHFSGDAKDLVKEAIDVAIRAGAPRDSSYKMKKVGTIKLILVATPSLVEKYRMQIDNKDLLSVPTLNFTKMKKKNQWTCDSKSHTQQSLQIRPFFSTDNFNVLKSLALLSQGISLMPDIFCKDDIAEGRLVRVYKDLSMDGGTLQILTPDLQQKSPRTQAFINFISKKLIDLMNS